MAKTLLVDDEPNIREVVGLYLRRDQAGSQPGWGSGFRFTLRRSGA